MSTTIELPADHSPEKPLIPRGYLSSRLEAHGFTIILNAMEDTRRRILDTLLMDLGFDLGFDFDEAGVWRDMDEKMAEGYLITPAIFQEILEAHLNYMGTYSDLKTMYDLPKAKRAQQTV